MLMDYKLSVIVYKENNLFIAKGIEIEIASQGETIEEALANLKEAFELWLKHADQEELKDLKKAKSPIITQVAVSS